MRHVARGVRWLLIVLLAFALLLAAWAAWVWWLMSATVPALSGDVRGGVSAPVSVARDAGGIPVITGSNRADLAYGLGFLHGQERFFQMDTLRRAAAGELSGLTGGGGERIDRMTRPHRFRVRARMIVAAMAPADRAILNAYVRGVNAGREALGHRPWEYGVLIASPEPWRPEDSILAAFAMYLDLQNARPADELARAVAEKRGGRALADFLFPVGGVLDAALDGSRLPDPPMPAAFPGAERRTESGGDEAPRPGSNNWAVAGALSTSGSALVANDMHLSVGTPALWFRARLVMPGLDISGVTLPGTPQVTVGSNTKIAWGFTNSYIDTSDAVIVEGVPGRPGWYRTPAGPRRIVTVRDRICGRFGCEAFPIRETIWGPIVARDAFGRELAMKWTAHDRRAIDMGAMLALERAGSVAEAIASAHRSAIPQQNFVVGDRAGNVAWTVIGQLPDRFGFTGRDAVSFADGTRGWRGMLPPDRAPVWTPADGRLWTANNRILGGEAGAMLGYAASAGGERAGRIRDLLRAKDRFAPADFLRIQLDDTNLRNRWWKALLLRELGARRGEAGLAALIPTVAAAGDRAIPGDRGYWLVAEFRADVIDALYAAYLGRPDAPGRRRTLPAYGSGRSEDVARRLLTAADPRAAPGGDWSRFLEARLRALAAVADGGEDPRGYVSGRFSEAGVRHPLASALGVIGWFADPPAVKVPGEQATVRAHAPGFGASERMAVSPGHEAEGLLHMPGSQAGNPRAPYYLAANDAWVRGTPTPFLPGPAKWTLVIRP